MYSATVVVSQVGAGGGDVREKLNSTYLQRRGDSFSAFACHASIPTGMARRLT